MKIILSKIQNQLIFTCLIVALIFVSCLKKITYPVIPYIEYISFTTYVDSTAIILFSFEDGDGDIGLDEGDTLNPYNSDGNHHFNLKAQYFEYSNNKWVPAKNQLGEDIVFNNRIPKITPQGKSKAIDGEIEMFIKAPFYNVLSVADSFRYQIVLEDRALNKSNSIITQSFPIPKRKL